MCRDERKPSMGLKVHESKHFNPNSNYTNRWKTVSTRHANEIEEFVRIHPPRDRFCLLDLQ